MLRRFIIAFIAAASLAVAPATASAYLHVADAQQTAVNHVWYSGSPNCAQWTYCYQAPVSGAYNRINDTAVDVRVRAYFRSVPNAYCTRWFYVRGNDPGYIAGAAGGWYCLSNYSGADPSKPFAAPAFEPSLTIAATRLGPHA